MHNKVIGYFCDGDGKECGPADVFVAIQYGYYRDGQLLTAYQAYCPVGQHSDLNDINYLKTCRDISIEEYLEASRGLFTPEDYLRGIIEF